VDEQQVGEVALADEPHGQVHELTAPLRRRDQNLGGAEAEPLDEQAQVPCVAADRVPEEPVVTAGQDAHPAALELGHHLLDLFDGFRLLGRGQGVGLVEVGPVDPGCRADEDPVAGRLDQVERLVVRPGAVVYDPEAVADRLLDRLGGVSVRRQPHPSLAAGRRCGGDLLIPEDDVARGVGHDTALAREGELDDVDAEVGHLVHEAMQVLGAELDVVGGDEHARRALPGGGPQPRAREPSAGEFLTAEDVVIGNPVAAGVRAREPRFEQNAAGAQAPRQAVLRRQLVAVLRPVNGRPEREVGVRLDQAGHQDRPRAVDDRPGLVAQAPGRADRDDPVALNPHVSRHQLGTLAVEDLDVREQQRAVRHGHPRTVLVFWQCKFRRLQSAFTKAYGRPRRGVQMTRVQISQPTFRLWPPSTTREIPVMKRASSEARKRQA
jgi:hypothetical protein